MGRETILLLPKEHFFKFSLLLKLISDRFFILRSWSYHPSRPPTPMPTYSPPYSLKTWWLIFLLLFISYSVYFSLLIFYGFFLVPNGSFLYVLDVVIGCLRSYLYGKICIAYNFWGIAFASISCLNIMFFVVIFALYMISLWFLQCLLKYVRLSCLFFTVFSCTDFTLHARVGRYHDSTLSRIYWGSCLQVYNDQLYNIL